MSFATKLFRHHLIQVSGPPHFRLGQIVTCITIDLLRYPERSDATLEDYDARWDIRIFLLFSARTQWLIAETQNQLGIEPIPCTLG